MTSFDCTFTWLDHTWMVEADIIYDLDGDPEPAGEGVSLWVGLCDDNGDPIQGKGFWSHVGYENSEWRKIPYAERCEFDEILYTAMHEYLKSISGDCDDRPDEDQNPAVRERDY